MSNQNPDSSEQQRLVICIGDIHGYFTKLENLWTNLQNETNPSEFNKALIIFLGDYCDRGPDTKKVIDFLLTLPTKYPHQTHVFLAGNHEFGFAGFVGALGKPLDGSDFKEGWKDYSENEEREGWYVGDGYEDMHLQGRRWAGNIKVEFNTVKDLRKAVPDDHKKFLADLVWVHEEDNVAVETTEGLKYCKLIAVHAGLAQGKPIDEQLKLLKARDTSVSKVECLSGRKTVWDMPQELQATPTVLVSGHHGKIHINGLRLIIDECGGYKDKPVAAIILPSMKIVRDTDGNS